MAVDLLGGERTFADAGDVRLGDADDGADARGSDAGAGDGAASRGRRTGDEGIGSVVDIEQRALRTLEHDLLAVVDGVVQHDGGVGDEGRDLLGQPGVLLVHGLGVERLGAEERVGDGVLLVAGVLDVGAQQRAELSRSTTRRPLRWILSS